jgi:hypothetical protein
MARNSTFIVAAAAALQDLQLPSACAKFFEIILERNPAKKNETRIPLERGRCVGSFAQG